jgi:hypothetical protein
MPSGRTRFAGKYITLPDIGVGACGRNTATQSFQVAQADIQSANAGDGRVAKSPTSG